MEQARNREFLDYRWRKLTQLPSALAKNLLIIKALLPGPPERQQAMADFKARRIRSPVSDLRITARNALTADRYPKLFALHH